MYDIINKGIVMMKDLEKEVKNIYNLFWIFIIASVLGYFIEGLWTFFKKGVLINHTCVVIGPFGMAYGLGAIVLTLLLYKRRKDNFLKLFLIGFISGTVLEYLMSLGMELTLGFTAWNYSSKFWNLNGRVSILYSICWGILAVIWAKLVLENLLKFIKKMDYNLGKKIAYILIIFLIFDGLLTGIALQRSRAENKGIPPSNQFEELLDKTFNKEYLQNMFNNNWGE